MKLCVSTTGKYFKPSMFHSAVVKHDGNMRFHVRDNWGAAAESSCCDLSCSALLCFTKPCFSLYTYTYNLYKHTHHYIDISSHCSKATLPNDALYCFRCVCCLDVVQATVTAHIHLAQVSHCQQINNNNNTDSIGAICDRLFDWSSGQ